jgi:hypothetical protein
LPTATAGPLAVFTPGPLAILAAGRLCILAAGPLDVLGPRPPWVLAPRVRRVLTSGGGLTALIRGRDTHAGGRQQREREPDEHHVTRGTVPRLHRSAS